VIRPAGPDDAALLADLLNGLSPGTAFYRFMGGLGGASPALVRALLRTGPRRGVLLAVEASEAREAGQSGERVVGHACWSVNDADSADLGVLVADEAQGRGIEGALFVAAAEAAAGVGARTVHLDVHPDNRRVVAILRHRLGPGALTWDQGLMTVDAPLADVVRDVPPATVPALAFAAA
jgi:ribosomal protein S18 acetylase RimI-like enzyme